MLGGAGRRAVLSKVGAAERRLAFAKLLHRRLASAPAGSGAGTTSSPEIEEHETAMEIGLLVVATQLVLSYSRASGIQPGGEADPALLGLPAPGSQAGSADADRWRPAVCVEQPMTSGVHYAQFELVSATVLMVGVVECAQGMQATVAAGDTSAIDFSDTARGYMWGLAYNGGQARYEGQWLRDQPGCQLFHAGETAMLELDVGAGALRSFRKRPDGTFEPLGYIFQPGRILPHELGYCWCVQFYSAGDAVRVEHGSPLLLYGGPASSSS
eukprot:SAG22_NODE_2770_length_2226_cov_2.314998_2_plen_270_part_00